MVAAEPVANTDADAGPARAPSERIAREMARRRTFGIVAHPDAGKTTLTEKLLLFSGAIQLAGTVKARKSRRHATSDWMEIEKQRGISVASSVMQFEYRDRVVNLLDTPGHQDFSEDTYRVLTAVDSALMVIDAAKGVEEQTIKLLNVCRMRNTPILTFMNKMDRETRDPVALLEEVESVLGIQCAPVTWPIGMGKSFRGVYHLLRDEILLFTAGGDRADQEFETVHGLANPRLAEMFPREIEQLMAKFRNNPPKQLAGSVLEWVKDYETLKQMNLLTGEEKPINQKTTANVLQFFTADGTKVSVRPSGTEPKIKFYIEVKAQLNSKKDFDAVEAMTAQKIDEVMNDLAI